jgi:endonuclease G, mitochondrial
MNFKIRISVLLLFGFFLVGFQTNYSTPIVGLEIPLHTKQEVIICHTAYCLSYNVFHKQANWVAYELTDIETQALVKRKNHFQPDPLLTHASSALSDYKKSGYDRGHLAPSADMTWSEKTMNESFYLSNISPQNQSFNRGIWNTLEDKVREYAKKNQKICVVTGPILEPGLPSIGSNKVSIPRYFYKALLDYSQPSVKAIAYLMKNEHSEQPLSKFVISIDSLEVISGIDFFPLLPDIDENKLEKEKCFTCWE